MLTANLSVLMEGLFTPGVTMATRSQRTSASLPALYTNKHVRGFSPVAELDV